MAVRSINMAFDADDVAGCHVRQDRSGLFCYSLARRTKRAFVKDACWVCPME